MIVALRSHPPDKLLLGSQYCTGGSVVRIDYVSCVFGFVCICKCWTLRLVDVLWPGCQQPWMPAAFDMGGWLWRRCVVWWGFCGEAIGLVFFSS